MEADNNIQPTMTISKVITITNASANSLVTLCIYQSVFTSNVYSIDDPMNNRIIDNMNIRVRYSLYSVILFLILYCQYYSLIIVLHYENLQCLDMLYCLMHIHYTHFLVFLHDITYCLLCRIVLVLS